MFADFVTRAFRAQLANAERSNADCICALSALALTFSDDVGWGGLGCSARVFPENDFNRPFCPSACTIPKAHSKQDFAVVRILGPDSRPGGRIRDVCLYR